VANARLYFILIMLIKNEKRRTAEVDKSRPRIHLSLSPENLQSELADFVIFDNH